MTATVGIGTYSNTIYLIYLFIWFWVGLRLTHCSVGDGEGVCKLISARVSGSDFSWSQLGCWWWNWRGRCRYWSWRWCCRNWSWQWPCWNWSWHSHQPDFVCLHAASRWCLLARFWTYGRPGTCLGKSGGVFLGTLWCFGPYQVLPEEAAYPRWPSSFWRPQRNGSYVVWGLVHNGFSYISESFFVWLLASTDCMVPSLL